MCIEIFIITPHSVDPAFTIKKQIVERLAICHQVKIYFGSKSNSGDFLAPDQIMNLYKSIDIFIADLSYERPSCYFEIGFVQALDKIVYLIATQDTEIHQVFNRDSVQFYQDLTKYKHLIETILRTHSLHL